MADYAYCHNDPVNHVDLLGLQTVVVEQPQMPGLQDLVDAAERAKRQKLLFEASIAFQDAYGKANGDGIAHLRVIREALAGRRIVTQNEINGVLKKGVPRGVDPLLYHQAAKDFMNKSVAAAKALKAQEVSGNPHVQKIGEIVLHTIETPGNMVNMLGGNDLKMLIFGTTDPLNPDRIDGTWEDRTMAGAGVLLIAVPSARGARMVDGSFDLARGSRTFANAPSRGAWGSGGSGFTLNPSDLGRKSEIFRRAEVRGIAVDNSLAAGQKAGIINGRLQMNVQRFSTSTVAIEEYLHARVTQRLINRHGMEKAQRMMVDPAFMLREELRLKSKLIGAGERGFMGGNPMQLNIDWLRKTRAEYQALGVQ